jgi:hypothetical protein
MHLFLLPFTLEMTLSATDVVLLLAALLSTETGPLILSSISIAIKNMIPSKEIAHKREPATSWATPNADLDGFSC